TLSPAIASRIRYLETFSKNEAKHIVELTLIALTHLVFCGVLLMLYHLPISRLGINFSNPLLWIVGGLLGIGLMGVSTLFCQAAMLLCESYQLKEAPKGLDAWVTVARGGWVRHHIDVVELLPTIIAFSIVLMQLTAEETVFRGILLNVLQAHGVYFAIFTSTLLFIVMQAFQMSSIYAAMFPMIGAVVMGVVHSILFVKYHLLLPLILSHFCYFVFVVI
ncbi:MAG: CPBP family intramembrane metalloprotease, partial [Coxiellaceae bacterium]|nr:CPBP family intramembrane metalloprotease [Coxiellaceae bacterium]